MSYYRKTLLADEIRMDREGLRPDPALLRVSVQLNTMSYCLWSIRGVRRNYFGNELLEQDFLKAMESPRPRKQNGN